MVRDASTPTPKGNGHEPGTSASVPEPIARDIQDFMAAGMTRLEASESAWVVDALYGVMATVNAKLRRRLAQEREAQRTA